MKQYLLGNIYSGAVLTIRDRFEIVKTAMFDDGKMGKTANDCLARLIVTELCLPNKTFIDAGAHIGSVSSVVHRNDPTVKIIAIEAMPDKAANLRNKFPYLEVHACALGEDTDGEISFYVDTKRSGFSSLLKPLNSEQSGIIEIKVPMERLDNLTKSSDVDLIKIDVEGVELGVLRGSEALINSRPVIMFESAPPEVKYTKDDMWKFLTDHQYEIYIPNRVAHNGPGLSKEGFSESHFYPRRTTDYFAIPIERRLEIRDRTRNILDIHRRYSKK